MFGGEKHVQAGKTFVFIIRLKETAQKDGGHNKIWVGTKIWVTVPVFPRGYGPVYSHACE